eukprot:3865388-Rhodomonas_salina.1
MPPPWIELARGTSKPKGLTTMQSLTFQLVKPSPSVSATRGSCWPPSPGRHRVPAPSDPAQPESTASICHVAAAQPPYKF